MRTLVLDIETKPNLVWSWGLYKQNIAPVQIVDPARVICWSAKWLGEKRVFFRSDFSDNHEMMLSGIWELLCKADAVMHYNGTKFDIPHLYREFVENDFNPPSPFRQIDLYKVVHKQFRFPSNKLEYVAAALKIGEKLKHEGFDLWKRCMANEASAWKLMEQYNKQDVLLVEELYEKILPWITGMPNWNTFKSAKCCPNCGSENFQSRGEAITQQSRFQRYQCQECGKWFRDVKSSARAEVREAL